MSQHCRANPCCGDVPCSGIPLPQDSSGLAFHNRQTPQAADKAEIERLRAALAYWQRGTDIINECLQRASKAKWEDAPFPLDECEAKFRHNAQAEAYRHALEMMGVPEEAPAALKGGEA